MSAAAATATKTQKVDRPGPLEMFVRRFKSRPVEDKPSDQDDLSRILAQSHISPLPRKPLPDLPPARTPSQFQHQRSNQLPHSVSLQYIPPSNDTVPHQQRFPNHPVPRHGGPSSYPAGNPVPRFMPIPSPYKQKERPQSVDHFAVKRMPNPWELVAPVPLPSLPSSLLTSNLIPRPVSAPVLAARKKPAKRRNEIVTDPLQLPGLHQCWGIKRDGTRCTRKIGFTSSSPSKARTPSKSPSPIKGRGAAPLHGNGERGNVIVVSDSEDGSDGSCSEEDERREYCHQHSKEINKTDGFVLPGLRRAGSKSRSRGDGLYIDFASFLSETAKRGGNEEENCKAKLRTAMSQTPSDVDWLERGYIYIYELRDRSTSTHIALKVGRAVNVYKRFEQWRSQCQSKNPLLRAFFPRPDGVAQDILPGAASVVEKGVLLSHKWEKLCHIELSYLGTRLDDKCNDCGSRHREIFLLSRDVGYDGVRRLVERWLSFVKIVANDGLVELQQP